MATQTKTNMVLLSTQLIAGTTKHVASTPQVVFAGNTVTPAQIIEKLQALGSLRAGVSAARAARQARLADEQAQLPPLRVFMNAYVAWVKITYGASPDVLADFGLAPTTRATPTVATKATAAAKRASTRAARHTMGSRQKSAVTGNVVGLTMTPVTGVSDRRALALRRDRGYGDLRRCGGLSRHAHDRAGGRDDAAHLMAARRDERS